MCDLRRLHVRSASCSRCSSRAAAAGARCRAAARLWRAAAAVGSAPADAAREPGHPQMVAGQAAGKLPYATTWWLLDAVARHATAASSDFFCVPFGGRANGRVCQQYLQRPQRPRELGTVRLRRRLLHGLLATRAPTASSACGCHPPHTRRLRVRRRLPHAACPPNARLTPLPTAACAQASARVRSCVPSCFEGGSEPRRGEARRGAERRASPPRRTSSAACVCRVRASSACVSSSCLGSSQG